MTALLAFHGQPELKAALLSDIEVKGLVSRMLVVGHEQVHRYKVLGAELGLDPGFLRTGAALAIHPDHPEGWPFLAELVRRVTVGADTTAFAQRWYLRFWSGASWNLESLLSGTTAHEPALAIIALLEESISQPVDPARWRSARRALAAATGTPLPSRAPIEVLLEMAWDLSEETSPIGDVVSSCIRLAHAEVYARNGWSQEEADQTHATLTKIWLEAIDAVGKPTTPEEAQKVADEADRRGKAAGHGELFERLKTLQLEAVQHADKRMQELRETVLQLVEQQHPLEAVA